MSLLWARESPRWVLTIILTATAFMFIISDNLPKVQYYNTAIDYYMLPSTISLALMAALRCLWCQGRPLSGMALACVVEYSLGQRLRCGGRHGVAY